MKKHMTLKKVTLTHFEFGVLIEGSAAGFRGTPSFEMSLTADVFNLISKNNYNNPMGKESLPQFAEDYHRMLGSRWDQTNPFRKIFNLLTNHALRYLYAYRKMQRGEDPLKLFRLLKRILRQKYGLELDSFQIGKGLYLGHPYNITVSEHAVIGDNCNLSKGVTIGAENRGERIGAPTLGNRVWVGTNAVLVGKITIGDNVLIAPNTYVNEDIPANSIVIGNPAQVIMDRSDATDGYINNVC